MSTVATLVQIVFINQTLAKVFQSGGRKIERIAQFEVIAARGASHVLF